LKVEKSVTQEKGLSMRSNKSSVAEDYQKIIDFLSVYGGSSTEDISEGTRLGIIRVTQILRYLDRNGRNMRNTQYFKDATKFWLKP